MNSHRTFTSPTFRLVAKGLVELHALIKVGQDDSSEADSIRDVLDGPLSALNRAEKERAQWLSEDLFSISEPEASVLQPMNPQAQQELNEAYEARQKREWDRSLALLRRLKEFILPSLLSYIRGTIWLEMGVPEVAAIFFGHASELNAEEANYQALYLNTLAKYDLTTARALAKELLDKAKAGESAPVVVAQAANIRFQEAKDLTTAEAAHLCQELIPILEDNQRKILNVKESLIHESSYAMTMALLGFIHEFLDKTKVAADYYTQALAQNPNNEGLLIARGILLYGSSPTAVEDFERAIQVSSQMVWPYLFLAHHYLLTNQFEKCREMCVSGLKMGGSDTANSQLEEWRAISQAQLGFPPESVRSAFEAALRYDPSNEFARRNQLAFEASTGKPQSKPRTWWEHKSALDMRQFGLSERRHSLAA